MWTKNKCCFKVSPIGSICYRSPQELDKWLHGKCKYHASWQQLFMGFLMGDIYSWKHNTILGPGRMGDPNLVNWDILGYWMFSTQSWMASFWGWKTVVRQGLRRYRAGGGWRSPVSVGDICGPTMSGIWGYSLVFRQTKAAFYLIIWVRVRDVHNPYNHVPGHLGRLTWVCPRGSLLVKDLHDTWSHWSTIASKNASAKKELTAPFFDVFF